MRAARTVLRPLVTEVCGTGRLPTSWAPSSCGGSPLCTGLETCVRSGTGRVMGRGLRTSTTSLVASTSEAEHSSISDPPYVPRMTSSLPAPVTIADREGRRPVAGKPGFSHSTQIICTLGPASRSVEAISQLLEAGMSVARLNFSHGTHEYHAETLVALRTACQQTGYMCGVLLDNKGPEVRTGRLKDGKPVKYKMGSRVTITSDFKVKGDESTISISYKSLTSSVKPGMRILMADGTLAMEVLSVDHAAGTVECEVLNTGVLGEKKNCNLPGIKLDLPILSDKDKQDLLWGIENEVDFLAVSFTRTPEDIRTVREFLGEPGKHIHLIAKIENQQGVDEIDEIIREADGIMIARGDLGMEVPLEKLIQIQKVLIRKANLAGKPVITATQMLESMCNNPRPTRAEATDVANAVLDGTDCVMLSGETAAGRFPSESVRIMQSICEESEKCIDRINHYKEVIRTTMITQKGQGTMNVIEAMASSVAVITSTVGAKCIVVLADGGTTARTIAKYRPNVPVVVGVVPRRLRSRLGFTEESSGHQVARQLMLTRGLIPYVVQANKGTNGNSGQESVPRSMNSLYKEDTAKDFLDEVVRYASAQGMVSTGQNVVMMMHVEGEGVFVRVLSCP